MKNVLLGLWSFDEPDEDWEYGKHPRVSSVEATAGFATWG